MDKGVVIMKDYDTNHRNNEDIENDVKENAAFSVESSKYEVISHEKEDESAAGSMNQEVNERNSERIEEGLESIEADSERIEEGSESIVGDSGRIEEGPARIMEDHHEHLRFSSYYKENYAKPKYRKHGLLFQMIAVSLVSSILGGAVVGSYFTLMAPSAASASKNYGSSQQSGSSTSGDSQNGSSMASKVSVDYTTSGVSAIAEKVGPSVVGIRTTATSNKGGIFGLQQSGGEGSGIVYTSDGYIITNYHVIESAIDTSNKKIASGAKIEVVLPNQEDQSYAAQVVGYDSKTDLAVIKIEASNLPAVELGNSDEVKVGEMAVAIGNPGGLEYMGSVTMGIISGLNRTIQGDSGNSLKLIQTDVAINPGNSGGALVNSQGQVIGINSVKIVADGYEGLGFAIPINAVKEITDNLIQYKYVKGRSYLGISVDQRYTEQVAKQYKMPAGVYVQDVTPLSGAYKAGIQAGDIITKFDGQSIKSYSDLENAKNGHKPGDTVSIEIYRDGQTKTVQIKLDEDQNN